MEVSHRTLSTTDDSVSSAAKNDTKTAQCSVVSVYHTKIFGMARDVRVAWSKNLINHSLCVSVEKSSGNNNDVVQFTCKVDLKPWPFWSKKGFKSFEVDGSRVDLFWDLRSAKFSGGPEPLGGYYVALVCNEEVELLLGDCKKEAYKRTKARPSLQDATLVSKRENVFGKKCFSTRAKFGGEKNKEHDIVVENSISGPKDPEMWISIDGVVLVHVTNLQWKFRGNEVVMVEELPVQVFWDVHDWLFCGTSGHALFIFKPGFPPKNADKEDDESSSSSGCDQISNSRNENNNVQELEIGKGEEELREFCFFMYAWKME